MRRGAVEELLEANLALGLRVAVETVVSISKGFVLCCLQ